MSFPVAHDNFLNALQSGPDAIIIVTSSRFAIHHFKTLFSFQLHFLPCDRFRPSIELQFLGLLLSDGRA